MHRLPADRASDGRAVREFANIADRDRMLGPCGGATMVHVDMRPRGVLATGHRRPPVVMSYRTWCVSGDGGPTGWLTPWSEVRETCDAPFSGRACGRRRLRPAVRRRRRQTVVARCMLPSNDASSRRSTAAISCWGLFPTYVKTTTIFICKNRKAEKGNCPLKLVPYKKTNAQIRRKWNANTGVHVE